MRSSRKNLDESYKKLFQMNPIQQEPNIKQEENVNNPAVPVDETSTYEKQKNAQHLIIICIKKISFKKTKKNKKLYELEKLIIKVLKISHQNMKTR
jgi:hypothetical protein